MSRDARPVSSPDRGHLVDPEPDERSVIRKGFSSPQCVSCVFARAGVVGMRHWHNCILQPDRSSLTWLISLHNVHMLCCVT